MPTPEAYRKNVEYYKNYSREWKLANREKATAYERRRAAERKDPEKLRANQERFKAKHSPEELKRRRDTAWLKNKYGITLLQRDEMLAAQGFECAICGRDDPGSKAGWHTDHNHKTGKVRGILCRGCNQTLGFVRDNPSTLDLMAQYLRHHA